MNDNDSNDDSDFGDEDSDLNDDDDNSAAKPWRKKNLENQAENKEINTEVADKLNAGEFTDAAGEETKTDEGSSKLTVANSKLLRNDVSREITCVNIKENTKKCKRKRKRNSIFWIKLQNIQALLCKLAICQMTS